MIDRSKEDANPINKLTVLPKIVYIQHGLIKVLIFYKFPIKDNY